MAYPRATYAQRGLSAFDRLKYAQKIRALGDPDAGRRQNAALAYGVKLPEQVAEEQAQKFAYRQIEQQQKWEREDAQAEVRERQKEAARQAREAERAARPVDTGKAERAEARAKEIIAISGEHATLRDIQRQEDAAKKKTEDAAKATGAVWEEVQKRRDAINPNRDAWKDKDAPRSEKYNDANRKEIAAEDERKAIMAAQRENRRKLNEQQRARIEGRPYVPEDATTPPAVVAKPVVPQAPAAITPQTPATPPAPVATAQQPAVAPVTETKPSAPSTTEPYSWPDTQGNTPGQTNAQNEFVPDAPAPLPDRITAHKSSMDETVARHAQATQTFENARKHIEDTTGEPVFINGEINKNIGADNIRALQTAWRDSGGEVGAQSRENELKALNENAEKLRAESIADLEARRRAAGYGDEDIVRFNAMDKSFDDLRQETAMKYKDAAPEARGAALAVVDEQHQAAVQKVTTDHAQKKQAAWEAMASVRAEDQARMPGVAFAERQATSMTRPDEADYYDKKTDDFDTARYQRDLKAWQQQSQASGKEAVRGESGSTPARAAEAGKAFGLTPDQSKALYDDVRKTTEWDNGLKKPESARVLSDGVIVVNPKEWADPDAYAQAVAATKASEASKADAMRRMPELRKQAAEAIVSAVSGVPKFKNLIESYPGSVEDKALAFRKQMEDEGFAGQFLNQTLGGGASDVIQQAIGVAAAFLGKVKDKTGVDLGVQQTHAAMQRVGQFGQGISTAAELAGTGPVKGFVSELGRTASSLVPAMAGGGAGFALRGTEAAAMVGSAAAAGGQSFGGMYAQSYEKVLADSLKKGLPQPQAEATARAESFAPALASGLVTSALTFGFGATGVESMFRNVGAREAIKRTLLQRGKEIGFDFASESLEEGIDQLAQGVIEQATFNPNKSAYDILNESLKAAFMGGILGGVVSGVKEGADALRGPDDARAIDLAASDAELEAYQPAALPDGTTENLKPLATALKKVAAGEIATLEELDDAELAAVGYKRDAKGMVTPLKDQPQAIYRAAEFDGALIITNEAAEAVRAQFPATGSLIGMDEADAKKAAAQKFSQVEPTPASQEAAAPDATGAGKTAGSSGNEPGAGGASPVRPSQGAAKAPPAGAAPAQPSWSYRSITGQVVSLPIKGRASAKAAVEAAIPGESYDQTRLASPGQSPRELTPTEVELGKLDAQVKAAQKIAAPAPPAPAPNVQPTPQPAATNVPEPVQAPAQAGAQGTAQAGAVPASGGEGIAQAGEEVNISNPGATGQPVQAAPQVAEVSEATAPGPSQAAATPVKQAEGAKKPRRTASRPVLGDSLDVIEQAGGVMSASEAKRKRGKEWFEANKSLWDDAPALASPTHNFIYGNGRGGKGTLTPDEAVEYLKAEGRLAENATEADMWALIGGESKSRASIAKQQTAQNKAMQTAEKQAASFSNATEDGKKPVTSWDLQVGDTLDIEGEKVKVVGFDEETGDAILQDGTRFGRQRLETGDVIYVEKVTPAKPAAEGAPSKAAKAKPKPDALASPAETSTSQTNANIMRGLGLPTSGTHDASKLIPRTLRLMAGSRLPGWMKVIAGMMKGKSYAGVKLVIVDDQNWGVKGGKGSPAAGGYFPNTKTIVINLARTSKHGSAAHRTFVHEVLHHLTLPFFAEDAVLTERERRIVNEVDKSRGQIAAWMAKHDPAAAKFFSYQLGSLNEFVSGLFEDQSFQDALERIPDTFGEPGSKPKERSILQKLMRLITRLIHGDTGIAPGTALFEAVEAAMRLLEAEQKALPQITTADGVMVDLEAHALALPAYHGTPHEIPIEEGFRTDKIGTGEGAQVYGHGLYFAGNKEVAKSYSEIDPSSTPPPRFAFMGKEFDPGTPEYHAASLLAGDYTLAGVRKDVARWITETHPEDVKQKAHLEAVRAVLSKASGKRDFRRLPKRANLYTVEIIPDEDEFLDWDAPLSGQSEKVKVALAKVEVPGVPFMEALQHGHNPGSVIYETLKRRIPGADSVRGASALLSKLGIHGIRYYDQGSRDGGWIVRTATDEARYTSKAQAQSDLAALKAKGYDAKLVEAPQTRNYVVFNEKDIRITHKNGEPVTMQEAKRDALASEAGDSLFDESALPFNLVGETAQDKAKREAKEDKAKAEKEAKAAAEAKKDADKRQGVLFSQGGPLPSTHQLSQMKFYKGLTNPVISSGLAINPKESAALHNAKVEALNILEDADALTDDAMDAVKSWFAPDLETYLWDAGEKRSLKEIERDHEGDEDKEDWGISKPLFDWVKQAHPETDDIRITGYVLPTGEKLAFTHGYGNRDQDHREVDWPYAPDDVQNSPTGKMIAMMNAGAMRVDANSGAISLRRPPTGAQEKAIAEIADHAGQAYIDAEIPGEDGYNEKERAAFEADAYEVDDVVKKIRTFYKTGKPPRQPMFSQAGDHPDFFDRLDSMEPSPAALMPLEDVVSELDRWAKDPRETVRSIADRAVRLAHGRLGELALMLGYPLRKATAPYIARRLVDENARRATAEPRTFDRDEDGKDKEEGYEREGSTYGKEEDEDAESDDDLDVADTGGTIATDEDKTGFVEGGTVIHNGKRAIIESINKDGSLTITSLAGIRKGRVAVEDAEQRQASITVQPDEVQDLEPDEDARTLMLLGGKIGALYSQAGDSFEPIAAEIEAIHGQAKDLPGFTSRVLRKFGNWIKPHIKALWDAAKGGAKGIRDYLRGARKQAMVAHAGDTGQVRQGTGEILESVSGSPEVVARHFLERIIPSIARAYGVPWSTGPAGEAVHFFSNANGRVELRIPKNIPRSFAAMSPAERQAWIQRLHQDAAIMSSLVDAWASEPKSDFMRFVERFYEVLREGNANQDDIKALREEAIAQGAIPARDVAAIRKANSRPKNIAAIEAAIQSDHPFAKTLGEKLAKLNESGVAAKEVLRIIMERATGDTITAQNFAAKLGKLTRSIKGAAQLRDWVHFALSQFYALDTYGDYKGATPEQRQALATFKALAESGKLGAAWKTVLAHMGDARQHFKAGTAELKNLHDMQKREAMVDKSAGLPKPAVATEAPAKEAGESLLDAIKDTLLIDGPSSLKAAIKHTLADKLDVEDEGPVTFKQWIKGEQGESKADQIQRELDARDKGREPLASPAGDDAPEPDKDEGPAVPNFNPSAKYVQDLVKAGRDLEDVRAKHAELKGHYDIFVTKVMTQQREGAVENQATQDEREFAASGDKASGYHVRMREAAVANSLNEIIRLAAYLNGTGIGVEFGSKLFNYLISGKIAIAGLDKNATFRQKMILHLLHNPEGAAHRAAMGMHDVAALERASNSIGTGAGQTLQAMARALYNPLHQIAENAANDRAREAKKRDFDAVAFTKQVFDELMEAMRRMVKSITPADAANIAESVRNEVDAHDKAAWWDRMMASLPKGEARDNLTLLDKTLKRLDEVMQRIRRLQGGKDDPDNGALASLAEKPDPKDEIARLQGQVDDLRATLESILTLIAPTRPRKKKGKSIEQEAKETLADEVKARQPKRTKKERKASAAALSFTDWVAGESQEGVPDFLDIMASKINPNGFNVEAFRDALANKFKDVDPMFIDGVAARVQQIMDAKMDEEAEAPSAPDYDARAKGIVARAIAKSADDTKLIKNEDALVAAVKKRMTGGTAEEFDDALLALGVEDETRLAMDRKAEDDVKRREDAKNARPLERLIAEHERMKANAVNRAMGKLSPKMKAIGKQRLSKFAAALNAFSDVGRIDTDAVFEAFRDVFNLDKLTKSTLDKLNALYQELLKMPDGQVRETLANRFNQTLNRVAPMAEVLGHARMAQMGAALSSLSTQVAQLSGILRHLNPLGTSVETIARTQGWGAFAHISNLAAIPYIWATSIGEVFANTKLAGMGAVSGLASSTPRGMGAFPTEVASIKPHRQSVGWMEWNKMFDIRIRLFGRARKWLNFTAPGSWLASRPFKLLTGFEGLLGNADKNINFRRFAAERLMETEGITLLKAWARAGRMIYGKEDAKTWREIVSNKTKSPEWKGVATQAAGEYAESLLGDFYQRRIELMQNVLDERWGGIVANRHREEAALTSYKKRPLTAAGSAFQWGVDRTMPQEGDRAVTRGGKALLNFTFLFLKFFTNAIETGYAYTPIGGLTAAGIRDPRGDVSGFTQQRHDRIREIFGSLENYRRFRYSRSASGTVTMTALFTLLAWALKDKEDEEGDDPAKWKSPPWLYMSGDIFGMGSFDKRVGMPAWWKENTLYVGGKALPLSIGNLTEYTMLLSFMGNMADRSLFPQVYAKLNQDTKEYDPPARYVPSLIGGLTSPASRNTFVDLYEGVQGLMNEKEKPLGKLVGRPVATTTVGLLVGGPVLRDVDKWGKSVFPGAGNKPMTPTAAKTFWQAFVSAFPFAKQAGADTGAEMLTRMGEPMTAFNAISVLRELQQVSPEQDKANGILLSAGVGHDLLEERYTTSGTFELVIPSYKKDDVPTTRFLSTEERNEIQAEYGLKFSQLVNANEKEIGDAAKGDPSRESARKIVQKLGAKAKAEVLEAHRNTGTEKPAPPLKAAINPAPVIALAKPAPYAIPRLPRVAAKPMTMEQRVRAKQLEAWKNAKR